jgi:hypothetical protein
MCASVASGYLNSRSGVSYGIKWERARVVIANARRRCRFDSTTPLGTRDTGTSERLPDGVGLRVDARKRTAATCVCLRVLVVFFFLLLCVFFSSNLVDLVDDIRSVSMGFHQSFMSINYADVVLY